MKIIRTVSSLQNLLQGYRNQGKTIGLVPTMGALHAGHAALVKRCVAENDLCVVSDFVNPTQFNNSRDLELYPRTPDADFKLLEALKADIVFAPSVKEVYPEPDNRVFDFEGLDQVMEGLYRPGHFNGVAQVVSKLFAFVRPQRAYFGEKDFQQLVIVRKMAQRLGMPITIVGVPIVREPSGLALSSRNKRLSDARKKDAAGIYRILLESTRLTDRYTPAALAQYVTDKVNAIPSLRVEYYEIVDGESLQWVPAWDASENIVGCITVYCDEVRLIDNIRYR